MLRCFVEITELAIRTVAPSNRRLPSNERNGWERIYVAHPMLMIIVSPPSPGTLSTQTLVQAIPKMR